MPLLVAQAVSEATPFVQDANEQGWFRMYLSLAGEPDMLGIISTHHTPAIPLLQTAVWCLLLMLKVHAGCN